MIQNIDTAAPSLFAPFGLDGNGTPVEVSLYPRFSVVVVAFGLLASLACTGPATGLEPEPVPDQPAPDAEPEPAPEPKKQGLRPASALEANCFGWPQREFSKKNRARPSANIQTGDQAVDFTLKDISGTEYTLSTLLQDKPVLLVQGSWTCPRFQENRKPLEKTVRQFGEDIEVVLVYNIEAHPPADQVGPYKGRPSPKEFSDKRNHKNYKGRVKNARSVAEGSRMTVLVDALEEGNANPIWCTYGTCASCSWLIDQNGTVRAVHEWHDPDTMNASIEALLNEG